MSQLILAYKRIPLLSVSLVDRLSEIVRNYNFAGRRRFITTFLIAGIGVSLVAYLTALYISFDIGLSLHHKKPIIEDLTEEVLNLEFSMRQNELNLANTNGNILQSMERVSAIKYIPSDESVAVSASLRAQ